MSGNLLILAVELELCLVAAATLASMKSPRWQSIRNFRRER
jgi:hypothetical protein